MKAIGLRWLATLSTILLGLSAAVASESTELIRQRSVDYVLSHPQACVVTDGYRCQAIDEAQILLKQQYSVPGRYLLAWPVVYADFKSLDTLGEAQKNLHHYTVGFAENERHFIVILNALLLPALDGEGVPSGHLLRSTFGKSMRYEIDKQSLKIVTRKLYR